MTVPERLDSLIESSGLKNRADFAKASGIPYSTIASIYTKDPDNITLKTIRRICSYFDCTMDFLVYGIEGGKEDAHILGLLEAAKGNDGDDIRRAAEQLQKTKALNNRCRRLQAYVDGLAKLKE